MTGAGKRRVAGSRTGRRLAHTSPWLARSCQLRGGLEEIAVQEDALSTFNPKISAIRGVQVARVDAP